MGVSKTFQKRLVLIENIEIEKKKLTSNSNKKKLKRKYQTVYLSVRMQPLRFLFDFVVVALICVAR